MPVARAARFPFAGPGSREARRPLAPPARLGSVTAPRRLSGRRPGAPNARADREREGGREREGERERERERKRENERERGVKDEG